MSAVDEYRKFTFGVSQNTDAGRVTKKADVAIAALEAELAQTTDCPSCTYSSCSTGCKLNSEKVAALQAEVERLRWMRHELLIHEYGATQLDAEYEAQLVADLESGWTAREEQE